MLASVAMVQPEPVTDTPQEICYVQSDSVEVVRLLADTDVQSPLDYARQFLGRPYVAHTLELPADSPAEQNALPQEQLVVNLRQFDCLTLLETCNALWLSRGGDWTDYTDNLRQLRYFDGSMGDYTSRLHYLTFSIANHLQRGTMEEVVLPEQLTRSRKVDLHYMSRHPQYYQALAGNPTLTAKMDSLERAYSGGTFRFLPQEKCGLSERELSMIHDGDILYIVTDKAGLDYAHQGYAYWKDGRLHMLHASSDRGRVIADERPLSLYLSRIRSSIGIRVFRLR